MTDPTKPQTAQMTQEMNNLFRSMRELINASSRTAAAYLANQIAVEEANEELEEYTNNLTKGRDAQKISSKAMTEAIALKKKEIDATRRLTKMQQLTADAVKRFGAESDRAKAAIATTNAAEKRLAAARIKLNQASEKASDDVDLSFRNLTSGTTLTNAALVWFGSTLRTASTQILSQSKANNGVIEGTDGIVSFMWEQQKKALSLGLANATQLAELTSANRQLVNSMGGTSKVFDNMNSVVKDFQMVSGSFEGGVKATLETMRSFAEKGVKPTASGMKSYLNDLQRLQGATGMNEVAAREYYEQLTNDVDMIDTLRSARADERESILANQRAMLNSAIAVGRLPAAALEATKMLNKMTAAKPLDRLKQAAKVRALGGALGIAGADEAAQGIIAGKRASASQRDAMMNFMTAASNRADQSAGMGLGSEIFTSTLLDKLDMEQYLGKGSPFSTTLGETVKSNVDLAKITESGLASNVFELGKIKEQLMSIVSGNNVAGVALAASAAALSILAGGKLMSLASNVMGKVGGMANLGSKATSAVTPAANAAAAVSTASKAGKLATIGKVVGTAGKAAGIAGAGLDVGLGINDLVNGQAQKTMSGTDFLSPMRYGMFIGDKINGAIEHVLGDSLGSKIYDWTHKDEIEKLNAPTQLKPVNKKVNVESKENTKINEDIRDAANQSASNSVVQTKKLDTSNDLLQKLQDTLQKQVEIQEKLLVASTLTDRDKSDKAKVQPLKNDNKFASTYQYL